MSSNEDGYGSNGYGSFEEEYGENKMERDYQKECHTVEKQNKKIGRPPTKRSFLEHPTVPHEEEHVKEKVDPEASKVKEICYNSPNLNCQP